MGLEPKALRDVRVARAVTRGRPRGRSRGAGSRLPAVEGDSLRPGLGKSLKPLGDPAIAPGTVPEIS
jgi:hypothetical protein